MSAAQHTPGPWQVYVRSEGPGLPHSRVGANTLLARVYSEAYGDVAQEEANARLIAAAPELLEASQAALRQLNLERKRRNGVGDTIFGMLIERIEAAIAKATGSAS